MLVVSMNAKRQRRPNVRLGEIGDTPAAFACGFPQKTREYVRSKRWKHDDDDTSPKQTELKHINGFSSSKLMDSDPEVSPRVSSEFHQNSENKNPNSSKPALDFVNSNETNVTMANLDFTNITRKCRVMKRRGRSTINGGGFFGGAWSPRLSSELSCDEGRVSSGKEFMRFTPPETSNDRSMSCGFKNLSDHETPETSKDGYEYAAYETTWPQTACHALEKEDTCKEDNSEFRGLWHETRSGEDDVSGVKRWLEELGFGKYAALFEMHEVDEEALPLLTLEDLKEMGVFAVGPRRKLYAAIQQLKETST